MRTIRESALIAYPFVLVGSFYATWIAARFYLGHWPEPVVDDPKSMSGAVMWTYDLTILIILIGFPIAVCLSGYSLFKSLEVHSQRRKLLGVKLASGVVLLYLALWFLAVDPQNVMKWFLD